MKINSTVYLTGCVIGNEVTGEAKVYTPNYLVGGKQRVTHIDSSTMWGVLIKTDKNQLWMNASWFS